MNLREEKKNLFSVVIPAYNEEGSIKSLIEEIESLFIHWRKPFEIIVVDDGSSDSTINQIKKTNAKLVAFNKNYGQSSALNEGINRAEGDYIITMDGDGQNSPTDIPRMFKKMQKEGLDLICGERRERKSKKSIKIGAKVAAKIRRIALDDKITDSGCTLKIFTKDAAKSLNLFRGMHRFIPALLNLDGYSIGEIEVNHRPRTSGQTKYNCLKYFPGTIGLLTVWRIKNNEKKHLFFLFYSLVILLFIFGLISLIMYDYILINTLITISTLLILVVVFFVEKDARKHYNYTPKYKITKQIYE